MELYHFRQRMSILSTPYRRHQSRPQAGLKGLLRAWVLLAIAALSAQALGDSNNPLAVNADPNQQYAILESSHLLTDPQRALSAADVFAKPLSAFKPLEDDSLRVQPGATWFRFSLHNTTDRQQRFWIGSAHVFIDYVELFKRGEEGTPIRSGAKYLNPEWEDPERLNILPLVLAPGESAEYLLRVDTQLQLWFTPKLYSDHSYIVDTTLINFQDGVFYGVLLAMAVFILHLFNSLRDKVFVFYLLYVVGLMFQTAAAEGTVHFFFRDNDLVFASFFVSGSLMNLSMGAFFTRLFLKLPDNNPWLDKVMLALGIIPILAITTVAFSFEQFRLTLVVCGVATLIASCCISAWRVKQGYTAALYVLAANLLVVLAIAVSVAAPEIVLSYMTVSGLLLTAALFKAVILGCGLSALVDNLTKSLSKEVTERTIRESQLMQAQQIARYGDWRWDTTSDLFEFSASALDILPKLPEGERLENDFERLLRRATKRQQESMRQAFTNALRTNQGFDTEFSLLHDDGTTHYYFTRAEFQRDSRGHLTPVLIGTIHDITDSKLADITNRENEQRWRELADSTFEAILIYQDGIIIDANQACESLLGYSPTQLIGTSGESFVTRDHLSEMLGTIKDATNDPIELSLKTRAGNNIMVEIRSRSGAFNQQEVQIVAIRDVTERLLHEKQLRQLGYYDSLTGLANRTLFQERLQHAIDKSKRYAQNHALLFIDLDQFKHVNDSLGHDIGDQLLVEVGRRLKTRVRKVDTVARLGGDEFAILVEDITAPYIAAKVAEEILAVMSEPIGVDEYKLMVTPSVGIALYPTDGDSGTELLRKADTAMYHAKSLGRNNYQFYTEALNEKMVRRMDMESELRLAIERDEFTLHYQPKVDLASGDVVGAEALLRWHSKKFGFVPPDEFIGIAEETGLIWPIGELVLRHACEQARDWLEVYPAFGTIAVNISGIQFNHINLVETLTDVVEKTGVPPNHIELEITEGAIINNAEEAIKVMGNLKELGVRLSLDDFGTGYSSLNYLKRFPVDSLKIDRSFVAEIVNDSTGQKIADNIVKLAHDLELTVVAEGVETEEQLSLIRGMGCDELQGYIFSPPLPEQDMSALLEADVNLYKKRPPVKSASNL